MAQLGLRSAIVVSTLGTQCRSEPFLSKGLLLTITCFGVRGSPWGTAIPISGTKLSRRAVPP